MRGESWREKTLVNKLFLHNNERPQKKKSVKIYLYNPKNLYLSEGLLKSKVSGLNRHYNFAVLHLCINST